MNNLFSYAKYAAFAMIALMIGRLIMFHCNPGITNLIITDLIFFATYLLICGFFIGLINNSQKGSPVITPSVIGVIGNGLLIICVIMSIPNSINVINEGIPIKLLDAPARVLNTIGNLVCCVAFIYLSFYFKRASASQFASWAIVLVLIAGLLERVIKPWYWEHAYYMIYLHLIIALTYGAYIWFLLSFANLKRK